MKIRNSQGAVLKVVSGNTLVGADLHGADLTGANLHEMDLHDANLSRANLYMANLRGANLTGADLSRADLHGVDLSRTYLTGADLYGARLAYITVNWQSRTLIGEILKRAAKGVVSKELLASYIQTKTAWCWPEWLAFRHPAKTWALAELKKWVKDGDNAPEALRNRI